MDLTDTPPPAASLQQSMPTGTRLVMIDLSLHERDALMYEAMMRVIAVSHDDIDWSEAPLSAGD